MKYLFLTGATGLVGRYLVKRVAGRRGPPGGHGSSRQGTGHAGRDHAALGATGRPGHASAPVVIEGDLRQPEVVIDPAERRWLAEHCDTLLSCAASMTFREDKNGEPFLTNIEGTRNLLAMCRATGIRRIHHVSTAYICGLRQGRILESEIDLGQTLGNVYEKSKLEAEKLIRADDFLVEKTFYRPASVVGDSKTGYVTSFHGFYLPLQLAHAMAGRVPVAQMSERFFAKLGLKGDEGKNLVPVDWLAAAISYLVTHPEHHGQTYHLASPKPVPVAEVQLVVRDAIERHYPKPLATTITEDELKAIEGLFYEYMLIYQSHWRDDPKFDLTNTLAALPHLPCPDMSYEVLMRVSRYPVERNFMHPRHEQFTRGFRRGQSSRPMVDRRQRRHRGDLERRGRRRCRSTDQAAVSGSCDSMASKFIGGRARLAGRTTGPVITSARRLLRALAGGRTGRRGIDQFGSAGGDYGG